MHMLDLARTENIIKIVTLFHELLHADEELSPFVFEPSYLRTLFNITSADSAEQAKVKMKAAQQGPIRPQQLLVLIDSLYDHLSLSIDAVPRIESERKLFPYLLHYMLRNLTGTNLHIDGLVFHQINHFIGQLVDKNQEGNNPSTEFIEELRAIQYSVLDIALQNSMQIGLTLQDKLTKAELQCIQLNNEINSNRDNDRISLNRSQHDSGLEGILNGAVSSNSARNSRPGMLVSSRHSTAGKFNIGVSTIRLDHDLTEYSKTQILAWLGSKYPEDADGFKTQAIAVSNMVANLKTLLDSLNTLYLDEYTRTVSRPGDSFKGASGFFRHGQEGIFTATKQVENLWTKRWKGVNESKSESLVQMINRKIVTTPAHEPTDAPPVVDLELVVIEVLKRAIGTLTGMLKTMQLPNAPDAYSWCMYLYAYRCTLFAMLRVFAPSVVNKDHNGTNVNQPKEEILNKEWPFINNMGEFRTLIRSLFTKFHTQELAHITDDHVTLEPPARCFAKALASIRADQASVTIDDLYTQAGLK